MGQLSGKRAIVTGGTSGIGFATAKLFIAEGATVAITGQNEQRLKAAGAELGEQCFIVRADAADPAATQEFVRKAGDQLGGIDILFLNAGITEFADLANVSEDLFDRQFAINVKAPLFTVQAAAPFMADGASIVFNTSVNARMGMAGSVVYAASKAAVEAMVAVLAGEMALHRIRVNAVSPGPVETPTYGKLGMPTDQLQGIAEMLTGKIPLGRFGQPDESQRLRCSSPATHRPSSMRRHWWQMAAGPGSSRELDDDAPQDRCQRQGHRVNQSQSCRPIDCTD